MVPSRHETQCTFGHHSQWLFVAVTLTGCLEHPVEPVTLVRDTPILEYVDLDERRDVDVLFVVDNSASMGEEQRALSLNFSAFVDVLESPQVRANYRLGVTTTDMGAGGVAGCKTPDNGALKLGSCAERPESFVDVTGKVNRFNTACASICDLDASQLEIRPTKTGGDSQARSRSWLENTNGRTNLVDPSVSMADAFRCFGPQGISGCGFESQLESMYQALVTSADKSIDPSHPNFGFLRDDALLAVVHVSDELDCSLNPSHPLYSPGGGELHRRVLGSASESFWGADQRGATSANCMHAGVHCDGVSGENYETCIAQDRGLNAEVVKDPAKAVLGPVSRYVEGVRSIADRKSSSGRGEVIVGVIGGVQADGRLTYPRAENDETLRTNFGIGAGCEGSTEFLPEEDPKNPGELLDGGEMKGIALPPVRMAQFANAFSNEPGSGLYSICQDDLTGPLQQIAKAIQQKLRPSCYFGCVQDARPDLDVLVPDCQVALADEKLGTHTPVKPCMRTSNDDPSSPYIFDSTSGKYQLPDGEDLCFVERTDFDGHQTADPHDNLDSYCREQKRNVELFVEYREDFTRSEHAKIVVNCSLSDNAALDCADL